MSEVQALVPAGWLDSCLWATLLVLHSRAEWSWDVHFWFWSLQHQFYWPTHCLVLYLLREALAEASLEARTQAAAALSRLPSTSLWWWIFHGLLRPGSNHCCHLLATVVSTDHSNHKLGYRGTQEWSFGICYQGVHVWTISEKLHTNDQFISLSRLYFQHVLLSSALLCDEYN